MMLLFLSTLIQQVLANYQFRKKSNIIMHKDPIKTNWIWENDMNALVLDPIRNTHEKLLEQLGYNKQVTKPEFNLFFVFL
jgi:hypothetical protein